MLSRTPLHACVPNINTPLRGCYQATIAQLCTTLPPAVNLHALCFPDHTTLLLTVHVVQPTALDGHQLHAGWWLLDMLLDDAAPVVKTATVTAALPLTAAPRHLLSAGVGNAHRDDAVDEHIDVTHPEHTAWLVMQDGTTVAYDRAKGVGSLRPARPLPLACSAVCATATGMVGLAGSELVAGERVVARDCTSFLVVEGRPDVTSLLLWTTHAHRLHVQPLACAAGLIDGAAVQSSALQPPNGGDEDDGKATMRAAMQPRDGGGGGLLQRSVERGSMLLAAPHGARVVCSYYLFMR